VGPGPTPSPPRGAGIGEPWKEWEAEGHPLSIQQQLNRKENLDMKQLLLFALSIAKEISFTAFDSPCFNVGTNYSIFECVEQRNCEQVLGCLSGR
jgi:hypothetical protein